MIRPRLRIPRAVGFGAGLLACALAANCAAGAVWGTFRPTISGTTTKDGGLAVAASSGAEFTSFITFALLTGLVGLVLGVLTYVCNPQRRGVTVLLWAGVCALAGAVAFYVFGGATAPGVVATSGGGVEIVPRMSPGIAWLSAPYAAMTGYWMAAFVGSTSGGSGSSVGEPGEPGLGPHPAAQA